MKEIKAIEFKKDHYGPFTYFDIEIHKTDKKIALREWMDYDYNSYIELTYDDFDKLVELVNKERKAINDAGKEYYNSLQNVKKDLQKKSR